jgi:hypothetical protein
VEPFAVVTAQALRLGSKPRDELAAVDVHDSVLLESALRELAPEDDDGLDPLPSADPRLEDVAQARCCGSKPSPCIRKSAGGEPVSPRPQAG